NTTKHHCAIELTALIPCVVQARAISIFVEIVGTLAVNVAHAGLQSSLNFPYPVQFPTLTRRVRMRVLKLIFAVEVELVGVVRDIHLLFAHKLEIEAILNTREHEQLIE